MRANEISCINKKKELENVSILYGNDFNGYITADKLWNGDFKIQDHLHQLGYLSSEMNFYYCPAQTPKFAINKASAEPGGGITIGANRLFRVWCGDIWMDSSHTVLRAYRYDRISFPSQRVHWSDTLGKYDYAVEGGCGFNDFFELGFWHKNRITFSFLDGHAGTMSYPYVYAKRNKTLLIPAVGNF